MTAVPPATPPATPPPAAAAPNTAAVGAATVLAPQAASSLAATQAAQAEAAQMAQAQTIIEQQKAIAAQQVAQTQEVAKGAMANKPSLEVAIPPAEVVSHRPQATIQGDSLAVGIPPPEMAEYLGTGAVGATPPAEESSWWMPDNLSPEQEQFYKQYLVNSFKQGINSLVQGYGMSYRDAWNTSMQAARRSPHFQGSLLDRYEQRRRRMGGY